MSPSHADHAVRRPACLMGADLVQEMERHPATERDAWIERALGIDQPPPGAAAVRGELIGYHASGIGALVNLIREVPIGPEDTFVDVGAGMGKAVMFVSMVTGARAIGLEIDPQLTAMAQQAAHALGLCNVSFRCGDARQMIPRATVYYLYVPFTGDALDAAMHRLEQETHRRPAIVCTLGFELTRCPWLRSRPSDDLWITIYDRIT